MHEMNKEFSFILVFIFILSGCKPPDEEPLVFDFKRLPGMAVIGNDDISVIYSDDKRTFEAGVPLAGGIRAYYFEDNTINYIRGSSMSIIDGTGALAGNRDTIGLEPFFSPFQIIETEKFNARTQIFVTGDGITTQQITIHAASDMNTFVRWSLYTPVEIESGRTVRLTGTDIMEDGVYHRYDNDVIIAFAAYDEYSQYNFDDANGITTLTTPLEIEAGADTTVGFFIAAGKTDMEVITKMFAAEKADLFDEASRHWQNWLNNIEIPEFPHQQYKRSFKANLYAVHASKLSGEFPVYLAGHPGDKKETETGINFAGIAENAAEFAISGERRRAEELIHEMIEHSNSYGLMPGGLLKNDMQSVQPLSLLSCKNFTNALTVYFKKPER